jgi:hypothetical protein
MPLARSLLVLALSAALGLPALAAGPSQRGSALVFHGWSRDSRLIAYTRARIGRTRPDQRMHRFVAGGGFRGFGKMVGGDVAAYARAHDYVVQAAPRKKSGETRFEFALPGGGASLDVGVARAQTWRLERAGVVLAQHTFDRIYVGFEAELYPAPDGAQGVLVMHLDSGWEIDAAIFPVPL